MSPLRHLREHVNGLPCLVLAVLVVFARLLAPVSAMPAAPAGGFLPGVAICHSEAGGEAPLPQDHSGQHDCLLCPACHLVSQAALPTPAPPVVPLPAVWAVGIAAPPPPATGPPGQPRTAAQPTGPPRLSA